MATATAVPSTQRRYDYKLPFVITASAAGTVIEWYDFYLYGVLAAFFSTQFFPPGQRHSRAARLACNVRCGLRRPALRRRGLRPHRRHRRPQVHVPVDHHGHGRVDRPRRRPADLRPDRHPRTAPAGRHCGWPRVWRSVASTAARRSTWPSTAPTRSVAGTPRGSRRPPRSACCSRSPWSSSPGRRCPPRNSQRGAGGSRSCSRPSSS